MLLTRTRLTTGPRQEHVYINVPDLGANESPAMSNKQLRNRFGLGSFPMSIGSVDWPVQTQKILYLAYLNWSLLHFFLILFIQTTFFILLLHFFVLQLQSSCSTLIETGSRQLVAVPHHVRLHTTSPFLGRFLSFVSSPRRTWTRA